jgi:hypothetical protein
MRFDRAPALAYGIRRTSQSFTYIVAFETRKGFEDFRRAHVFREHVDDNRCGDTEVSYARDPVKQVLLDYDSV